MKRIRFTLGAAAIAAGLFYLFFTSVQQSAAAQLTLATLLEQTGRRAQRSERFQLGGSTVVPGSIQWDEYRSRPEFTITDGTRTLRVRYTGNAVLPDTFQDRAMVVLEGQYDPGKELFDAQMIYAKCPSKYEGQNYDGTVRN